MLQGVPLDYTTPTFPQQSPKGKQNSAAVAAAAFEFKGADRQLHVLLDAHYMSIYITISTMAGSAVTAL